MSFLSKNLILLLFSIFIYLFFRGAVFTRLRMLKISKRNIKKHQKGIRNYLLYAQLHKNYTIGNMYYFNAIYLCLLMFYGAAALFSWVSFLQIPIVVLGILLGTVAIPVWGVSLIYYNLEQFGCKLVLFRIYKSNDFKRRRVSSVLDWFVGILPLGMYIFLLIR